MSEFHRVVLSTNEDHTYFQFWPYVARAWQKLFGVKVSLAVVTNRDSSDPWVVELKKHGDDVVLFPEIDNVPIPNLAQVVRHILAATYDDEVCMINDIDLLPLQTKWYLDRLAKRGSGQLLALGAEFFKDTPHEGKFPMGYVTAEGHIWKDIVNPLNLAYGDLVRSWIGLKVFDHKEDIARTVWHEHREAFADESLMRVWLSRWPGFPDNIIHAPWSFKPRIDSVDRSRWVIDIQRLYAGEYVESHMLRPYSDHVAELAPLLEYIDKL